MNKTDVQMPGRELFIVPPESAGHRLDRFLADQLGEISRTVLARLVDEGRARIDDAPGIRKTRLKSGQRVEFDLPDLASGETAIKPEPLPIAFLHEDDDIAVVAKEAGICVHPSPGHPDGTLVNGLLQRHPKMAFVGSMQRPGVVHRLDMDTSGVIIFALTSLAYHNLVRQIKERAVQREYLAVVHGVPEHIKATINMPIGRDESDRRRFTVRSHAGAGGARIAITHYEVAERLRDASVLAVKLETGRTHQIRVHMKRIKHPVWGDTVYAPERPHPGIDRQALHARRVEFRHPVTRKTVSFEAPVPADIRALIEFLR